MVSFLYVHFSKKMPSYVTQNINRTKSLFPDTRVYLVTNLPKVDNLATSVKLLNPTELDWHSSRLSLKRDMRFWDGWWQKTFDRLLFIRPIHELHPHEPLIQVESDVALFPSFLTSGILDLRALAYPMYSKEAGVGSILYSPNLSFSEKFELSLLEELARNQATSDMEALGRISSNLENYFLELREFPLGSSDTNGEGTDGMTCFGFDGASHGEWICGQDPKAHWGIGRRRQLTPISSGRNMGTYFVRENQMYCTYGLKTFPIHNLHVHSKELVFFAQFWGSRVDNILKALSDSDKSSLFFVPKAFIFCLVSNIKIWASSFLELSAWKRLVGRLKSG